MIPQKETAGCEPAGLEVSVYSDFASRIVNGQVRNGYALEVLIPGTDLDEPRKFYTERVPPTGYARYHLLSPVTIRILRKGGQ